MFLLLLACNPFPCEDDQLLLDDGTCVAKDGASDSTPAGDSVPPDETGEPREWTTLPAECTAPSDLPADPLTQVGVIAKRGESPGIRFLEALDLEIAGDALYAVGQGGMLLVDISDPSAPGDDGWFPADINDRYHKVEVLGTDLVALTHRDFGLFLSDTTQPGPIDNVDIAGAEGLLWHGEVLYVTVRDEGIRTFELFSNQLAETGRTAGLAAPWSFSGVVDGWTYVADNSLGVVPVDVSSGDPVIGTAVDVGAAVLHVEADGDWLYASMGGSGVAVLDRSDPAAPVHVATLTTGGSAVMSSVLGDVLWVSDHEGLALFDISDPTNATPLAREVTEQFALAVTTDPATGLGWVGDWNLVSGWAYDATIEAPDLDLPSPQISFPSEGGTIETEITNRGNGTLSLAGATVASADFVVDVDRTELLPGQTATLRVAFNGTGETTSSLCLASNDPESPTLEVVLVTGQNANIGKAAPDFSLSDVDGNTYRLSEHLGSPVVLVYFATW